MAFGFRPAWRRSAGGAAFLRLLLLVRDPTASHPKARREVRGPFVICARHWPLLVYAPLHQIALQRNFSWHRADRERIVARVEAGELKPNVGNDENLIALGDSEPNVSAGGNDILVDLTDQGTYVLFLTSRGLKHYFTGFLHVPPGGDPAKFFEFEDKPPSRLERYDKDWYFVAN